jgi:pyrophosphate--fructose-6-phosphate 1-phosphotransferase
MTAMQRATLTSVLAAVLIVTASAALAPTLAPPASGAGLTMVPAGRKLAAPSLPSLRGGGAPGSPSRVAILTAGGLAPCLSSAIGFLIEEYSLYDPSIEIICFVGGYKGLLKGEYLTVGAEERKMASVLTHHGGSAIGNSRVKLTNIKDCVKRGLVKEGEDPQKVAADMLVKLGVDVLHTIGGDDTNTAAADLAAFLAANNYALTVVGMPKTIDNDVYPIRLSLGAKTAASQGALFFRSVVNEHSSSPRMLIVHEVMGRHCGWLTAATAQAYRDRLKTENMIPGLGLRRESVDIQVIYIP